MKKTTKRIILLICTIVFLVTSLLIITISCSKENQEVDQPNQTVVTQISYALLLDNYKIENYSPSVKVTDANGKTVSVNQAGEFIVRTPGKYTISYGETEVFVYAYAKEPNSTFNYSENLNGKQFIAGDTLKLPSCNIENVVKKYKNYSATLSKDGEVVATFENAENASYFIETSGNYKLTYFFTNVFGSTESNDMQFNAIDKKRIVYSQEILDEIIVGKEVSYITYGYYLSNKYQTNLTVKTPTGNTIVGTKVLYNEYGEYTLTFTSNIAGENIKEEYKVNTTLDKSSLFSNKKNIDSVEIAKLDEFCLASTGSADYVGLEALKINASNSGSSIYYSSIIDLSTKTASDSLIEFYVDKSAGTLNNLYVTLIDVYNPSITLRLNWMQNQWNAGMSYGKVSVNNQVFFWNYNGNYDTYFGTNLGCGYVSGTASGSFNCSFDWNTQSVYMSNAMIADLTDEQGCPPNLNWQGFTTGEVYLRIDFIDCNSGNILVKSVNGKDVKDIDPTLMKDDNAICLDKTYSTLPNGVKGIAYPLPSILDNKAVELYEVKTQLYLGEENKSSLLKNNSFVPDKAGDYTVVYQAIDSFGKLVEKRLNVVINESATPIVISGNFEDNTVDIMNFYELPEYTISGGHGNLNEVVSVKLNGVELQHSKGGYFIGEKGTVDVCIKATDYLGIEVKKQFTLSVNDDVQIFYHNPLPNCVFVGESLNFNASAVNYKTGGDMSVTLYINDVKVTGDYTVPNGVDKLRVLFIAKDSVKTKVSDIYEIEVLGNSLTSIADYAQTDFSAEKAVLTSGVVYKLEGGNKDYSFTIPYNLSAYQFAFKFGFNESKMNASKVLLTLQDSKNPEELINIYFSNLTSDKALVKVNDDIVDCFVKWSSGIYTTNCGNAQNEAIYKGKTYRTTEVILDINTQTLLDSSGAGVATIKKYANGNDFAGFSSGAVICSFKVLNVTSSTEFILSNVCNQSFSYRIHQDGLNDNTEAVIALTKSFDKYALYGEEYTIPAIMAYDVLSACSKVCLEIKKPSGGRVVRDYLLTKDFTFTIDEYGIYRIILTSIDAKGNNLSTTINLKVEYDKLPEIIVNGNINEKYSVGDILQVPGYTVTQNVSAGDIEVIVMVKDACGALHEVTDSFKLTTAGTYQLIYRATDEYYNVTRVVYTFVVE